MKTFNKAVSECKDNSSLGTFDKGTRIAEIPAPISRHTVVCRAAQENGARARYVSILPGITKSRFSHTHNSVFFYLINPKVAVEVPAY